MQVSVGQFDGDDGPVHQHPHHKDEREEHDDIHRQPHEIQHRHTREERTGNSQPDQQRRPQAQRIDDNDHHKDDRRDDVRLEVGQHGLDGFAFVERIADLDAIGPIGAGALDHGAHFVHGVDDIGARAFLDFKRQCGLPVDARKACGIFKRAADRGDIGKSHDGLAARDDRQIHHILHVFDQARHLENDAPRLAFDGTGGDQLVVARDRPDQFVERQIVGLEHGGVDQHFEEFVALARHIHLEHAAQCFDLVLQVVGDRVQRSFGYRAGQDHRQDREQRRVDLGHGQVHAVGQVVFGTVGGLAHVIQRLTRVITGLEFQLDGGKPLARLGDHRAQARQ